MPFLSQSRVGAAPKADTKTSSNARPDNGSRRRGITMEDLKRQTALRLAQEQKNQNRHAAHDGVTTSGQHDGSFSSKSGAPSNPSMDSQRGVQYARKSSGHVNGQGVSFSHASSASDPSVPSASFASSANVMRHFPSDADRRRWVPEPAMVQGPGSSFQPRTVAHVPPYAQPSYGHASKLPTHGLTVEELKEMTKARLQAEAAEKHRESTMNAAAPPLPFVPPTTNSQGFGNYAPQQVANAASSDNVQIRRSQMLPSPVPPGFQTSLQTSQSTLQSAEATQEPGWPSQVQRSDTWENGSTTSNISEFSGYVSQSEESTFLLGNRSRSNSTPVQGFEGARASPAAFHGASPLGFDPSIQYNRRRAVTLSPRTEQIREDRPSFGGPSVMHGGFRGSSSNHSMNRNATSPLPFLVNDFGPSVGPGLIGPSSSNRTRASSVVSLPSMSKTAEEFLESTEVLIARASEPPTLLTGFSPSLSSSALSADAAGHRVISGVLNSMPEEGEVFAAQRFDPVHQGSFPGVHNHTSSGLHTVPGQDWKVTAGGNTHDIDDGLSQDLGSILKLSGASERDDQKMTAFDSFFS